MPGLDGLRAIAIWGVLAFHLRIPGAAVGWAGIQLFFVVSGFLITRILLSYDGQPRPFRTFYVRRALRIFPIYYLYIGLIAVGHLVARNLEPLQNLPFYLTYTQNFPSVLLDNRLVATEHTFSLAIEEQFYWLWPVVVLVVNRRFLLQILIGLLIAAPLWRLAVAVSGAQAFFAIGTLPSQIDAITAGALIAYMLHRGVNTETIRRAGWASVGIGAGLGVILTPVIGLDALWNARVWPTEPAAFLYLTALAVLFGGIVALVAVGVRPGFLEWRFLRWTGRISYGLYLYQAIVFLTMDRVLLGYLERQGFGVDEVGVDIVRVAVDLAVTYLVAAISWRIYETRFLALKERLAPTTTAPVSG